MGYCIVVALLGLDLVGGVEISLRGVKEQNEIEAIVKSYS